MQELAEHKVLRGLSGKQDLRDIGADLGQGRVVGFAQPAGQSVRDDALHLRAVASQQRGLGPFHVVGAADHQDARPVGACPRKFLVFKGSKRDPLGQQLKQVGDLGFIHLCAVLVQKEAATK